MTYEERFEDLKREENRELYDQPNLYEDEGLYEPTTFGEQIQGSPQDDSIDPALYEEDEPVDATEAYYESQEPDMLADDQGFGETLRNEEGAEMQSEEQAAEQPADSPGMLERAREKFEEWTDREK